MRIERPNELVRERVVDALVKAIIDGVLPPGHRLTERAIIELTGVSRTSIREALRELQTSGLVEPAPGRGLRVAVLGEREVADVYDVRAALEPAAIRLFAENASDEDIAAACDVVEAVAQAHLDGGEVDLDAQLRRIVEVDAAVLAGCGNPFVQRLLGDLHRRIDALRRLSFAVPGRIAESTRENLEIFALVRERRGAEAAALSREYVLGAKEAALEAIRREQEGRASLFPLPTAEPTPGGRQ